MLSCVDSAGKIPCQKTHRLLCPVFRGTERGWFDLLVERGTVKDAMLNVYPDEVRLRGSKDLR